MHIARHSIKSLGVVCKSEREGNKENEGSAWLTGFENLGAVDVDRKRLC